MTNPRVPFVLADQRPKLSPPDGKPLIVHFVVNIESWPFDSPPPRKILTGPHGVETLPDVPNFSWAEYGLRAGMPRLFKIARDRNLPTSAFLNAGAIDDYPSVAQAVKDIGWEVVGHGLKQKAVGDDDDEAALLKLCLDKIEAFYGKRPRGWLGPGLRETNDTPDILASEGVDYICDWVLDDLPHWMTTKHGPVICMPYTLELNDSPMYAIQNRSSGDFYQRYKDTVATFEKELDNNPRILTIATHPHLMGVPHRIGYLEKLIDELLARDDSIFMTGSQIADWFIAADKAASN
jgi:allantoinase